MLIINKENANDIEQIAAMPQAPAIAFISDAPADRDTIRMCRKLNIFSWHPNFRIVTPDQVDQVHSAGLKVFSFTVNNRADAIKMLDTGVDGIITDEPALARQVMAERSELNSVERLLIHAAVMLGRSLPQKEYRDQSP